MRIVAAKKGAYRYPSPDDSKDGPPPPAPAPRRGHRVPIMLVDPRALTRECFARWIEMSARNFRIVPVSDPAEVSDSQRAPGEADLILVNIGGAEVTDGSVADTLSLLRRVLPDTPIVVLSEREDAEQIAEAMRHGVRGYIPTSLPPSAVIEALRFVRAGGVFVPACAVVPQPVRPAAPEIRSEKPRPVAPAARPDGFTARELDVLARLCEGKPNKVIAYELDIRDSTVKVHVRHIMKKLKASNRTQVVCLARRLFEAREPGTGPESGRSPRAALADEG